VSATAAGRKLLRASRLRRLAVLEGYVETMTPAKRAAATGLVAAIERITDTRALTADD